MEETLREGESRLGVHNVNVGSLWVFSLLLPSSKFTLVGPLRAHALLSRQILQDFVPEICLCHSVLKDLGQNVQLCSHHCGKGPVSPQSGKEACSFDTEIKIFLCTNRGNTLQTQSNVSPASNEQKWMYNLIAILECSSSWSCWCLNASKDHLAMFTAEIRHRT